MASPKKDDKILIFKEKWLKLIISGKKTLEIRCQPYKAGNYWLGFGGRIYAKAELGEPICIQSDEEWAALKEQHCVDSASLPYKKRNFGLPILSVTKVSPTTYRHPRGAIGIVRMR